VNAAETVLRRDGQAKLTVRSVAAEAGIAPMSLYNRFGDKQGLIDALLIRGFDRLRECVEPRDEADMLARLRGCGRRYREFALANPHLYAIMFEGMLPEDSTSDEVETHASAAFGALVRSVQLGVAAGVITAPDPVLVAQQIWSSVHGAVTLELKHLTQTPDAETAYLALLDTILRGLA
jgi:AcrR family transcriptional regulator